MDGHTLVAVYPSLVEAEQARDRLQQIGIPAADIRLSTGSEIHEPTAGARRGRFWDWLFTDNIPEYDRSWYEKNLREGRTAVSVRAHNDAERDRIVAILEEFNPIDFDHAGAVPLAEAGVTGAAAPTIETAAGPSRSTAPAAEETEVIPVVKEELDVGKRATERRYRVRTYVVEKPIEEAVTLRDERVVIEHRPVTGDRVIGEADFPKEREYEVVERHEEPVVTKHRTAEDVVVRKEAEEHTETVRDTLRETRVDVDKEEAKPAAPGPNRNR